MPRNPGGLRVGFFHGVVELRHRVKRRADKPAFHDGAACRKDGKYGRRVVGRVDDDDSASLARAQRVASIVNQQDDAAVFHYIHLLAGGRQAQGSGDFRRVRIADVDDLKAAKLVKEIQAVSVHSPNVGFFHFAGRLVAVFSVRNHTWHGSLRIIYIPRTRKYNSTVISLPSLR